MKKTCVKCGDTKDISEFNKRKDSKDGYRNDCIICTASRNAKNYNTRYGKEYSAKMYKKHRESVLKHKKETYDPIAKKKYNDEYVKVNKQKIKEQRKKYYTENKEEILRKKKEQHIRKKPPITTKSIILRFKKIHGDMYNYSNVVYQKSNIKINIKCNKCGLTFKQNPADHSKGIGCPKCKRGHDSSAPSILYYLRINNGEAYKIGITNNTVGKRYSKGELDKIEVLETWECESGEKAKEYETNILKEFAYAKYKGDELLLNGNTELFDRDILGLDN